jgi:hypothetical protein|tara:strand:+ start:47 stop:199 length:153 start_codon:yes stop_codon:yes gene_type:complete
MIPKMFKITVSKPGDPFTGALYPEQSVDNALDYFNQNGYTVIMVESTSTL